MTVRVGFLAMLMATAALVGCKSESEAPPARTAGGAKKATKAAAKGSSDYTELATVPNAGKITGVVSYGGDKKDGALGVQKEKCEHAADPRDEKALIITDGKVANAIVYIDGITEGKKANAETVTIDNIKCEFQPRVQVAVKGANIAAKNSDPILHNTHLYLSQGNKNLFNVALPQQGQVIEKKLRKTGLVDVKCDAHEWMQAWVYVADHPYTTVTGTDGSFVMTDVPPGEYKVKVWHEKLGEKEATAKVEANGEAKLTVAL